MCLVCKMKKKSTDLRSLWDRAKTSEIIGLRKLFFFVWELGIRNFQIQAPPLPVSMYGSNDTESGMCRVSSSMCHVSTLNFGDPSRNHEMHRRFRMFDTDILIDNLDSLILASAPGALVIVVLFNKCIDNPRTRDTRDILLKIVRETWLKPGILLKTSILGAGLILRFVILKDPDTAPYLEALIALLFNIIKAIAEQRITRVDYQEMTVFKMHAQDADIATFTHDLEQDEIVDQPERKLEEVGMRSKLITMLNKKLTSASIHISRFWYLSRKVLALKLTSISLLGLMICILFVYLQYNSVIKELCLKQTDLSISNGDFSIIREDKNMMLKNFGWSHGRLLATQNGAWAKGGVQNSDMISSHISSKYKEETSTVMENETVKSHQATHLSHKTTTVGLWIALSVIGLVLVFTVWLLLRCKCRKREQENELELSGGNGPRRFQLCELAAATSNFRDDNKLGQGGFGPVYKGYLRNQDCHVAIKVLSKRQSEPERSEQGLREFKAEVKVMNQLRHRNIVKLVGWCDSENRLMLVYELMAQGSLDKHLYDSEEVLTWQQRYKIVLGLGSGLLYLHRDCEKCIVHGDIKPANIMLDTSYNAKLGDFGLARLVEHGEQPQTTQVLAGTPGYIDPEFLANRWPRTELDVYSFGVVLLEIACGKRPASRQPNGASSLLTWVIHLYGQGMILDAADQRLNGEFDLRQMERVLVTGLWCAHQDPVRRPSVEEAMDVLRSACAELPVLRAGAVLDDTVRRVRSMEEQAYGELPVEDRPVHAVAPSTYFTSKDSAYLLAQE